MAVHTRARVETLVFEALGGSCELYAVDPAEPLAATAAWIHRLHDRLTRFDPHSELSRFNTRAGEWVEVSPELEALLRASLDAFAKSGGLVNIAVLPALLAAGYDQSFEKLPQEHHHRRERSRVCDEETPATRSEHPAVQSLDAALLLRKGAARLERGAAIDLGGIAKGWIADRAVERLGLNALASCAGDLFARGRGPEGEGWPVGFGDRTVLLADMGAATSGTTKRRWGEGLHHLIDPRTGRPSATDLSEVSVLAATALDAEVLAKTALLLGSPAAEAYLEGRSQGWVLA